MYIRVCVCLLEDNLVDLQHMGYNVFECDFLRVKMQTKRRRSGEELGVPRHVILSVCKETWPRLLKKDVAEQDGRCCDQRRCGEING